MNARQIAWRTGCRCLVTLGIMLLTGCGGKPPAPTKSLRLGVQGNVICALPFIAAENEFFRDEGLDVEIVQFPSGKLALKAMFAGDVDMAACADMPIMTHSFERGDFQVFGTIAWTERGAWIIARPDKGIATPDDLRGKTIATQRNSAVHFFLSAFLAKHGIDEQDVTLVFMEAVELPKALADGRIDAFSMRNPFIAQAVEQLHGNVIEMFSPNVYRQTFNLVTSKQLLRRDQDLCKRILAALVSAENLLIHHEEKAREDVIDQLGQDRAAETRSDWDKYVFALSLDQSILVTLEDQARWAIARNDELPETPPNYLSFIETGPLLAVKPSAVNIIR